METITLTTSLEGRGATSSYVTRDDAGTVVAMSGVPVGERRFTVRTVDAPAYWHVLATDALHATTRVLYGKPVQVWEGDHFQD